ncbi:hypothetical protein Tco_0336738 [Tanacetum coccineum]
MARNRHQVARRTRRVFGRNNYNRTLKAAVDPKRQLEISRERRANLVPAEVLYSNNRRLQHIHLGIFMIRLHALHRRIDLSAGTQLVYTFPDMILSVNDFHNHVEVSIQTHGYDTWQGGESNLLITMALTGRLSNTSYMGFQYSVENVVDHLTTTGIIAIPSERRIIEELEGMSWHLKPPEQTSVRVPSRVAVNERLNRSVCKIVFMKILRKYGFENLFMTSSQVVKSSFLQWCYLHGIDFASIVVELLRILPLAYATNFFLNFLGSSWLFSI